MTNVYLAVGGGGDALAASIIAGAIGEDPSDLIIATWAWDRLIVDPVPGPRSPADFTGLENIGFYNHRITPTSKPRPPSGSTLPALAAALPAKLVLIDPLLGAQGARRQLTELMELYGPEHLTLVDVGGDLVATGGEAGLRSPLADALALASLPDGPARALIAGPGLDGELSEAEVIQSPIAGPVATLTETDVDGYRAVFEWHPSEATALLVAAARGCRGSVEIRDAGHSITLTDNSPGIYAADANDLRGRNQLASALIETTSRGEAEAITRKVCGFSEIDYERTKAATRGSTSAAAAIDLGVDRQVATLEQQALERNTNYFTIRRIAEALQLETGLIPELRRWLVNYRPASYVWPLWKLEYT